MDNFLEKIKEQLTVMSEETKNEWIISQAKITPEYRQEDFFKSLSGKKRIIHMPETKDIDNFCTKVSDGEIVIEYETHYVEFDDMGFYHDDWEQIYHDPSEAFDFIGKIIKGCHDMVILEEYEEAQKIMEQVLKLKFCIVDHVDTDDSCADEYFNLNDAVRERLLIVDGKLLLKDYIISCWKSIKEDKKLEEKILEIFEMKFLRKYVPEEILAQIRNGKSIINVLKESVTPKVSEQKSFLSGTWKQIKGLLGRLQLELYIDDQIEIEEIWNISQALIKRGRFDEEPWVLREEILTEIYKNGFYDEYGCYDAMKDLSNALCTTIEENLKRAAIMMQYDGEQAARLYRELGEEEMCVKYFETHLGKISESYEIVMDYYKERNPERAKEVAELAMKKCEKNQTPFVIYLMEEAMKAGDMVWFNKLNMSAHRRRAINAKEVEKYFNL